MKNWILIVLISLPLAALSQEYGAIYNMSSKLNVGFSSEHLDHIILSNNINDTGSVEMNFNGWSPSVSYTQDFIFGDVITLSANLGFQYMNMEYGGGLNMAEPTFTRLLLLR